MSSVVIVLVISLFVFNMYFLVTGAFKSLGYAVVNTIEEQKKFKRRHGDNKKELL